MKKKKKPHKECTMCVDQKILSTSELFGNQRELWKQNVGTSKSLLWKRIYDSFDEKVNSQTDQ